ncbi:MAG: hypothetical protein H5T86_06200 [Armatimonadetes bacterium]|nr:hypothetical protein [Armatimonadota bacterium]
MTANKLAIRGTTEPGGLATPARKRPAKHLRLAPSRRGLVAVWAAVGLIALCLLAAMAVDTGQVMLTKSRLQTASDAAALAAALDRDDPYTAAAQYCRDNLLPGSTAEPQLESVSGNTYTYALGDYRISVTTPYQDSETQEAGYDAHQLVYVAVSKTVQPFFGTLGGRGEMQVSAASVALRQIEAVALPAIFAHEMDWDDYGFTWTGSGGVIVGDIIANSRAKISGSNHVVHGAVFYGSTLQITGSGHQVDEGYEKLPAPADWPIQTTVESLGPIDYYIEGDLKFSGSSYTIPPGVYYVTGDVSISGSSINASGVTIIAGGKIKVSGSSAYFEPARNGVLFYALGWDVWTIDISGSGGTWSGICYAPNGSITFTGSGHFIHEGCLIAETVKIAGSDFELRATGEGTSVRITSKLVR